MPTPAWAVVSLEGELPADERGGSPWLPDDYAVSEALDAVERVGGYPLVVKPNDQGSTVGLTVVEGEEGLVAAIREAAAYSRNVLVETYIPGRELTVAILGGEALPVVEIAPKGGLYDYESKYTKGMSEYTCPANVSKRLADVLQATALHAFRALGCRGYARVDYRVAPNNGVFCLEVNTVPGMTDVSLVPMAAAAAGIGFGDLVDRIVRMALK